MKLNIIPNCNYYEIYFIDGNDTSSGVYKKTSNFEGFLNKMKELPYKFSKKQYKQYIHETVTVHNYNNDEVKVEKKTLLDNCVQDNLLVMAFQKTKLSVLNISSTRNIMDIKYIKKLTFRINNWLYLNFELAYDKENDMLDQSVYLNYNHDDKVDVDLINKSISDIVFKLSAISETSR